MMEQGGMDENQNNYILSFIQNENGYALSYCDVSTGELKATNFEDAFGLIVMISLINVLSSSKLVAFNSPVETSQ
jgi:DNA mismatch repair protein MutS